MSKIKIKQFQLFGIGKEGAVELNKLNPNVEALITFPAKNAGLKYDIDIKLNKAVAKAVTEFHEQHKKLLEDASTVKKVEFKNGKKEETRFKIVELSEDEYKNFKQDALYNILIVSIDGKEVETPKRISAIGEYDIAAREEFNKRWLDLLNLEIELDCWQIKLSKLEKDADASMLNFAALEAFITDDRE